MEPRQQQQLDQPVEQPPHRARGRAAGAPRSGLPRPRASRSPRRSRARARPRAARAPRSVSTGRRRSSVDALAAGGQHARAHGVALAAVRRVAKHRRPAADRRARPRPCRRSSRRRPPAPGTVRRARRETRARARASPGSRSASLKAGITTDSDGRLNASHRRAARPAARHPQAARRARARAPPSAARREPSPAASVPARRAPRSRAAPPRRAARAPGRARAAPPRGSRLALPRPLDRAAGGRPSGRAGAPPRAAALAASNAHEREARVQHPLVHRDERRERPADAEEHLACHELTRVAVRAPRLAPVRVRVSPPGRLRVDERVQSPLREQHDPRPAQERAVDEAVRRRAGHVVEVDLDRRRHGRLGGHQRELELGARARRQASRPRRRPAWASRARAFTGRARSVDPPRCPS